MIYELEIKKHADALYEWMLVRFPDKIGDGSGTDLSSVLLAPVRGRLVQANDRLSVVIDGIAVGIYAASVIDDDAAQVARDVVAILRS